MKQFILKLMMTCMLMTDGMSMDAQLRNDCLGGVAEDTPIYSQRGGIVKSKDADTGQNARERFEFQRNLPIYADSLIADLHYPLAWGNSGIKKFSKWKKVAREKVLDCMMPPLKGASLGAANQF